MPDVWTHGIWTVRDGREDASVSAWASMARPAPAELEPAASPALLRDRGRRNVFVRFDPSPSTEAVETFRRPDAFREGVAATEGIGEPLEPIALDEVSRGD